MRSRQQATLESALKRIKGNLQKAIERQKMTQEESEKLLLLITITTDLGAVLKDADVVIETVSEDMELKKELFREITKLSKKEAVFSSNTSTLSITEIASATDRPERFIGVHFFNPVILMPAVEIIRGISTNDETVELAKSLAIKLGKTPVVVKDAPGFASTRLGVALFAEASKMLEEGVAGVKDIDTGAKLFYGHRMGPFETCDIVGLDARLNNMKSLFQATGNAQWSPPLLLKQLVAAGYIGKKPGSKGGYYAYFGLESQ
jgi:3-hydroxybutyryl-CoA dehydrogenase